MSRKPASLIAAMLFGGAFAIVASSYVAASVIGAEPEVYRPTVRYGTPERDLLQDVFTLAHEQETEDSANFTAIPDSQPPGLSRLGRGAEDQIVVDVYEHNSGLKAFVRFSVTDDGTCDILNDPDSGGVCVRNETLPEDPALEKLGGKLSRDQEGAGLLRHVTIYLTHPRRQLKPDEPKVEALRTFWSDVPLVPVSQAAWFTELLDRARAAEAPQAHPDQLLER